MRAHSRRRCAPQRPPVESVADPWLELGTWGHSRPAWSAFLVRFRSIQQGEPTCAAHWEWPTWDQVDVVRRDQCKTIGPRARKQLWGGYSPSQRMTPPWSGLVTPPSWGCHQPAPIMGVSPARSMGVKRQFHDGTVSCSVDALVAAGLRLGPTAAFCIRGRSTSAAETTRSRPAARASAYQERCSC